MMLFRKDMEPRCAYCARGARIDEGHVACVKRGIVAPEYHCAAFVYDPLRRVPPRPMKLDTDKCPAFRYDPLRRTPPRPAELNTAKLSPEDFQV